MLELVFVYGTLMRGNRNHRWMLQDNPGAEFVGEGWAEGVALYKVTSGYPGVILEAGSRTRGEVFRVDQQILRRMDDLEDEGDLYRREKVAVSLDEGPTVETWVYLWNRVPDPATRVPEERQPWRSRRSRGG